MNYRGSPFLSHDAIVGIPVIVCSTGRQKDIAQQMAQRVGIHIRMRIVRTDDFGVSFDRNPLLAGADDYGAVPIRTEMQQLARAALKPSSSPARRSGPPEHWRHPC